MERRASGLLLISHYYCLLPRALLPRWASDFHFCHSQVCELLTESMQEHDRTLAQQHGMSPGLAVGKDGESQPVKENEVNRYAAQRTSCPTM